MTENTLIKNLQNPDIYPHEVKKFQIFETHSAYVITTGDYAYKIKKPVNFGFLDYSSLDKRTVCCHREFELNRRLASSLYLECIPIYGTAEKPSFDRIAEEPCLEYAIKMREFPQDFLFPQLLLKKNLTVELIDKLAKVIADFHQAIPIDQTSHFGTPKHIHQFAMDNFSETLVFLKEETKIARLKKLENMTQSYYEKIETALQARKDSGFVRHCHGDMHLNNIVLIDGKPLVFDCIEFNEDFVWTDVMGDLGFIIMDLDEHKQPELANLLLNRYLELTGDYTALNVLPYFCAYRAMVRAKVNQIRLQQPGLTEAEQTQLWSHYNDCLDLTEQYLSPRQARLMITQGFSASGKTTVAKKIVAEFGAIQLRSDVERKRSANLALNSNTESPLYQGLYKTEITEKLYADLAKLAAQIIKAGYSVIVDATFIRQDLREIFSKLAQTLQVPFTIVACVAPEETLKNWLTERKKNEDNISEARLDILDDQLKNHDPLTKAELEHTITLHTDQPYDISLLRISHD